MNSGRLTKLERAWQNAQRDLGCIVCLLHYHVFSPCDIHHIDGVKDEMRTLGLCPPHHRNTGKGYETLHGNKARFEQAYGTEEELLTVTREMLEGCYARS